MSAGPLARLRAATDARLSFVIFAVALVVRVVYLLEIAASEFSRVLVGDAVSYDAWARALAGGDWLGHEVFYQAPLYPYFVGVIYAVVGPSAVVVRFVQAALGAASCVLLAAAGRRFFSREVGLVAGLALAVYGPAVFFTGLVHKMTLDLFFTTALLYAVARVDADVGPRRRWLAVAGVALGCLALTRENALAWLPVLVVWLAWRSRGRALGLSPGRCLGLSLGLFLGGVLLVLGPVAARNAALGGVPLVTTSQAGVNFYLGNNADADGTYTPLRFGHGAFAQERQDAIEIAEQARGRALTPAEISGYWSSRAWQWISEHPAAWVRLLARKWMLVWGAHEIADSDEPAVYRDASLVLRVTWVLSFGVLVPLALVGLVESVRERRRGLLVALLLASAASTALFLVFARYRVPMIPLLLLFAVAGGARLVALARERPVRPRAVAAALGLVALAAVLGQFPRDHGDEEHPRATAQYNLGVTLEGAGEPTRAADAYRAALADNPALVEARVNLGALLARSGDLEGAIREETEALRAKPDDATAHTDLGNALLQSGRLDEAEANYRAALRVEPDFPSARDGLEVLRDLRARPPSP